MRPRFDPTGEIEVQSDSMCLSAHSWLKRGVKNLPDCSSRRMPGAQSSFLTPNPCVKVSIDAHDAVHLFVSSVIRRHRVQLVLFGSKSWLCSDPLEQDLVEGRCSYSRTARISEISTSQHASLSIQRCWLVPLGTEETQKVTNQHDHTQYGSKFGKISRPELVLRTQLALHFHAGHLNG